MELRVMISGGFSLAYFKLIPEFEKRTGVTVTTLSGASQGTGPKTIKYQLEQGADVDVVILSGEGLAELQEMDRILEGSPRGLARAALGAAVRYGSPKPDISSPDSFKQALLASGLVCMPGSTSGLYIRDEVFPALGVSGRVAFETLPRGIDSTALLAAGGADLALGPVSELVEQPGVEVVGELPAELQLVQTFTGAILRQSGRVKLAADLISFLSSEEAHPAIRSAGMEPVALPS